MALHDPHPLGVTADEAAGGDRPQPLARFGRYLLFKRLRRDALGEVYRAGKLGPGAVECMVTLRLFNGAGIEAERFSKACRERADLGSILRGAPFAELADSGREQGVAFVAYRFVLGRSLAELLLRVREKSNPVLLEHTLLVMDRIALALQNAYEARHDGKRIVHGFLVPDFVNLSSEGEVRLGGFESSGGLLDLDATSAARAELAGYLSPEVNSGQPPEAADDVYSLGSIFGELLTGEPVPALDPSATGSWVDSATLATSASPLPEKVRHLLRQSLLPRDRRIQSAKEWHRALIDLTPDGFGASATFDLAFFMHSLFGAVFEVEDELVAAEMQAEVPPLAPLGVAKTPAPDASTETEAPAAAAAEPSEDSQPVEAPDVAEEPDPAEGGARAGAPPAPPTRARRSTNESKAQSAPAESSGRKWIAAAAALLGLLGLGAAYLLFKPSIRSAQPPATLEVAAAPRFDESGPAASAAEPVDALDGFPEVPPPLSPEELESQVRTLVAERAGDLEANLKAEYDQRLEALRRQLEEARKATPAARGATSAPVAAALPAQKGPAEVDSRAVSTPASRAPATAPVQPAVEPEPPASASAAAAGPTSTPEPRSAVPEAPAEIARGPEPAAVEDGPIAVGSSGVSPPTLLRQPSVVYPPAAARLKRQATVRVRILVDEQGRPSEIEQLGKKVGLGFDAAALQAARTTRWNPAERDGVPVEMWVELAIDFRL